MFSIYKISNSVNGKLYIGWTINPTKRWSQHKIDSRNNSQKAIHRAIRKYGIDNFFFEVIYQTLEYSHILEMEIYFIQLFNSFGKTGYNMTKGGEGTLGFKPSEETLKRMKLASLGENNGMYGKKHSSETKALIRDKAKTLSAKTYILQTPDGTIITVTNLLKFCQDNDIPYHNLLTKYTNKSGPFKKGRAKGWLIL